MKHKKKEDLFYARKEKLIQFSQFNIQNELSSETTEKEFIALVEKGEKLKAEFQAEQKRIKAENEQLKKESIEKEKKAEIERKKIEKAHRDGIESRRLVSIDFLKKNDFQNAHGGMEAKKYNHFIGALHYSGFTTDNELEYFKKDVLSTKEKEAQKIQLKKALEEKKQREEKEAKKAEQNRKAELAPDKERMTKWIADMTIIDIVNDRMSKESVLMASEIIDKFNLFKVWATEKVNLIK